jgi:hypothetical protein
MLSSSIWSCSEEKQKVIGFLSYELAHLRARGKLPARPAGGRGSMLFALGVVRVKVGAAFLQPAVNSGVDAGGS